MKYYIVIFFLLIQFNAHNLIDLKKLNPNIIIDIRYATKNNFTHKKMYSSSKCFVHKDLAEKLTQIQQELEKKNLGLKVWDAYRPIAIQKKLWKTESRLSIIPLFSNWQAREESMKCQSIRPRICNGYV